MHRWLPTRKQPAGLGTEGHSGAAKPKGLTAYVPSYGGNKLIDVATGVSVMPLDHKKSWSALEKSHAKDGDQAIQCATKVSGENGGDTNKKHLDTRAINDLVQVRNAMRASRRVHGKQPEAHPHYTQSAECLVLSA